MRRPVLAAASTENLVFMMNMHGFMNDAQFQAEMKAKLVEQVIMLGDTQN
jgi:hypothetical protein